MLQEIYKNQIEKEGQSKESALLDRKLIRLSKSIDYKKLETDEVYQSDTLCQIAVLGDEKGFIRGFKYAVQLLVCCFE